MSQLEVIDLTEGNAGPIGASMPNFGSVFVVFLAPWCGHCQHFKPEWEKIKHHLKKGNGGRAKGHVLTASDTTMQKLPAEMKKPSGFPTMSLYDGVRHIKDYSGGRNMEEIVAFLKQHMNKGPKHKKGKHGTKRKRTRRKHHKLRQTGGGKRRRKIKKRKHTRRRIKRRSRRRRKQRR